MEGDDSIEGSLLASVFGPYDAKVPAIPVFKDQLERHLVHESQAPALWPHCRSALVSTRYSDPFVLALLGLLGTLLLLVIMAGRSTKLRYQLGMLVALLGCLSSSQMLQRQLYIHQELLMQQGWVSGSYGAASETWLFVFWVIPMLSLLILLNLLLFRQLLGAAFLALRRRMVSAEGQERPEKSKAE